MLKHAVVWLDHKEARVFMLHRSEIGAVTVTAPRMQIHHKHPKGPEGAREHPEDAKRFFSDIRKSLDSVDEVLVVGPSSAKLEYSGYVREHARANEPKIVGVETLDHPTDGQIIAYAREFFRNAGSIRSTSESQPSIVRPMNVERDPVAPVR